MNSDADPLFATISFELLPLRLAVVSIVVVVVQAFPKTVSSNPTLLSLSFIWCCHLFGYYRENGLFTRNLYDPHWAVIERNINSKA